jgi:hypothetical protein
MSSLIIWKPPFKEEYDENCKTIMFYGLYKNVHLLLTSSSQCDLLAHAICTIFWTIVPPLSIQNQLYTNHNQLKYNVHQNIESTTTIISQINFATNFVSCNSQRSHTQKNCRWRKGKKDHQVKFHYWLI